MDQKLQIILSAKDVTQKAFTSASARVKRFTKNVFSMRGALVATAGVAAMGAFVKKSMEAADAIGKAADAIGISTGTLQEYRHAARISGVETKALDKSIGQFTKRVGEARIGTGSLVTFLQLLDENLLKNIQSSKSTDEALDLVFKRMGQTASATDKAALANAAFGRSGLTMVNMVKDGAAGLAKLRQEARDLGIVMDDHLIRQSERANDEIEKLTRVIKVQFMSAAVGLAPEIARIAQNTTDWWKANQELVKTDIHNFLIKTRDGILGIKEIYDDLPEGVGGAAGVGLIVAIIGRSGPLGALVGMLMLLNTHLKKFYNENEKQAARLLQQGASVEEITKAAFGGDQKPFQIGPKTQGYDIYQPPPTTPKPTPFISTAPKPIDWKKYWASEKGKIEMSQALKTSSEYAHEDWRLRTKYSELTASDIAAHEKLIADFRKAGLDKSKQAFADMYADLRFQSEDYYSWQKDQYQQQADAYVEASGSRLLAEQWLNEQIKELDAQRLEAAGETSQVLIELSERTSDAIEDTFSDMVYDLKDGWKDWQSYFRKLSDSMWRITSDIVGQTIKEWLFGTAKTTAALATEGAQVGVLTQMYYALAAAKAAAGMGGGNLGLSGTGRAGYTLPFGSASGLQHGGPAEKDRVYVVGEKGPEIFVPSVSGTIIPNNQINQKTSQVNQYSLDIPMTVIAPDDDRRVSLLANKLQSEFEQIARRVLREEMR